MKQLIRSTIFTLLILLNFGILWAAVVGGIALRDDLIQYKDLTESSLLITLFATCALCMFYCVCALAIRKLR